MNRPVETRVLENLSKYVPIVNELGQQHPEFSRTIELVKLAVNGLSKYYGLFTFDQHRKLIIAARLEDDYSRNVTLIGREVKTWAGNPDLTLAGKKAINRLYLVLERCLRDALELYTEAERELWRQGGQIRMSAGDAFGEYERAKAALWKFQYDFHLHQIDAGRGTDRAIIYDQSGFSGPPAPGFVEGGFAPPDWQKSDDDRVRILTHEEQVQLKSLLDRPEVQRLLFSDQRNPTVIVISDDEDDNDDNGRSEPSVPIRRIHPLLRPRNVTPQRNGILKTPRVEASPDRPKKSVRFGPYRSPPLPTYTDDDGSSRNSSMDRRDPPPQRTPIVPSYTPPPQRPSPPPIVAVTSPTDESSESGWTSPPTSTEPVIEEAADPQGDQLGFLGPKNPRNKRDTSSSAVSSSSSSSSSSSAPADTRATRGDLLISIHTYSSPSSSPSLPSVGEPSPTAPAPPPKDGGGDSSATISPSDEGSSTPPGDRSPPRRSEERPPARTAEELRREEVALNARAYLGLRHDEYSLGLPSDFGAAISALVKDEIEDENEDGTSGRDAAAAEDVPYDHGSYAAHDQLGRVAGASTARDVKATALLHWAGVTRAKRQERLDGRRRLSEILGWAERAGKVPLSPASVREGTGLRRGIFVPLGPPDLPPPWSPRGAMRGSSGGGRHRAAVEDFDPGEYAEAALAGVEQVRPRLDLTLSAFLFNEDALRLFGGLVGEKPRPSDLARMDKILRELVSWNDLKPPPPPIFLFVP